MEIQELITQGANITISVTAQELATFAKKIVAETLAETREKQREILIPRQKLLEKISATTLWTWEKREFLTPVRRGARVYYKKSDLDAINFEI
jgi:hypothetical protein